MRDSLLQARIPIGSYPEVRLQYSSCIGGARVGKLVKDMDLFAAIILYKHIATRSSLSVSKTTSLRTSV